MLDIVIDPGSTVPPYEQLRQRIVTMVRRDELIAGTKLPTVRGLAEHLGGCETVVIGHGGMNRRAWVGLAENRPARAVRSGRELTSPLLAAPPQGWLARVRGWLGV